MKTFALTFVFSLSIFLSLSAQVIRPVFTLNDKPGSSHNAHITSDGKFFYTCNGGTGKDGTPNGKISKYTLNGDLVKTYSFSKFDMRSIMYNSKDKHLYISTYDLKIYKIVDLESGTTELRFEKLYKNPQSAIAMDPDGKTIYAMDGGTLTMYKFKDGSVIKTLSGLSFGADDKTKPIIGRYGSTAVAVDKKYIYTWDAWGSPKKIYAYDKDGNFKKSFQISSGNWGFTLSYANGYVFVAIDGQYKIGLWNGYKLW
jgi:DNA-binding beta-propeller fold protein YncE